MYRKGPRILLLVVLSAVLAFSVGCHSTTADDRIFVKGRIDADVSYSDISILINGIPTDNKINKDGSFELAGLFEGDIVSFYLAGYVFNDFSVGARSSDNAVISAVRKLCAVTVSCDPAFGRVDGADIYTYGETVNLSFTPCENFIFDGLYENGLEVTSDSNYSFTAVRDIRFEARFSPVVIGVAVEKSHSEAKLSYTESGNIGDTVFLEASDDENFKFVKFIVDGVDIFENSFTFVLEKSCPRIRAEFLPRAAKPTVTCDKTVVSYDKVENSAGYAVYVDGNLIVETSELSVDLFDYPVYSGRRIVSVFAKGGEGYADSVCGELEIDYVKPIDTPCRCAISRENEKVYFAFSKVLCAAGYRVSVNGIYKPLSEYSYKEKDGIILIDLEKLMTKTRAYEFCVIAEASDPAADSRPSAPVSYDFKLKLTPPAARLENGFLTWTHPDADVTFEVFIDCVKIYPLNPNGIRISDYTDSATGRITVAANKENYEQSYIVLEY